MPRLAALLGLLGCHSTLELGMAPRPAVALQADRVAVIARERSCIETADAVARALGDPSAGLVVDPRAEVKLEVFGCGDGQTWTIDERDSLRTGVAVEARAFALVEVRTFPEGAAGGRTLAHLLATGVHTRSRPSGGAGAATPLPVSVRGARRGAIDDLARDLALQLSPVPTLVQRRVYPNAPDGSARELLTRAVHAEAAGNVQAALDLVERAMSLDPEPGTASYLRDLRRAASVR